MPARRRIDPTEGRTALSAWRAAVAAGAAPSRAVTATAVRWSLEELAARSPGATLEVRIPPFGVTQCLEGPSHTRGTPPNVIETDAVTWLSLVLGETTWSQALESGRVAASGLRADLTGLLPLVP